MTLWGMLNLGASPSARRRPGTEDHVPLMGVDHLMQVPVPSDRIKTAIEDWLF